jgi:hypothetical protein
MMYNWNWISMLFSIFNVAILLLIIFSLIILNKLMFKGIKALNVYINKNKFEQ